MLTQTLANLLQPHPPTINEKTVEIPNLAQDTKKVAPKVTVTPEVVNQPKQLPKYE